MHNEDNDKNRVKKFTWREIKQLIEKAGVGDEDEIDGIDISWGAISDLECRRDEILGWQIIL